MKRIEVDFDQKLNRAYGKRLLNVEEMGEVLGVRKSTIYYWTQNDLDFPTIKVGRHTRFDPDEVIDYLKEKSRERRRSGGNTDQPA